jgi:predicted PurR-regulated permease PerM
MCALVEGSLIQQRDFSITHFASIGWTALALYLSFLVLEPFLTPVVWAVALALLAYPLQRYLARLLHSHSIAAGLVTISVGLAIIVPSIWVAHSLVTAAAAGFDSLVPSSIGDTWKRLATEHPSMAAALTTAQRVLQLSNPMARMSDFVTTRAQHLIGASIRTAVHCMLTLFVMYFLLRDGPRFLAATKHLIPLDPGDTETIIQRVHDTIHAALFGVIAVAMLQGFLGALLLYWLDLPGAVFWGMIMGLLALIPYLGTFIVWIPVASFLAIQGDWHRATVTVLWGTVVIGLADNLLYPYLVGKRLHYHTLIVFFFLLGGVFVFGSAGVVLGPVILAITERLLWVWQSKERGTEE